ncbi:uncharacterized protein LOC110697578 isoform X2 [Chenopodium quinoa]|uniref:uncharacterized protein LOC110697578 isoform X2 n=1 Tax=Chenopodium quinoa TaxID=63459 RepID=UPI000B7812BF|nr:uncharacterized protein LOC110697578 isoform X2 [Chenopodium quinoa]
MDYNTLSLLLLIEKPVLEFSCYKRRLAVSSDHQELYLIDRLCRHGTRDGIDFTIYKLNKDETKWDVVEGVGDDKILFVTFDESFFASVEDFQGWKGNCIVFYRGCSSLPDQDDSLFAYNFYGGDCQYLASYQSRVFWPPPTWLSSNALMSKWATKEDEQTQSDVDSEVGEFPTPIKLDLVVVEQFVEAPSISEARGSISRAEGSEVSAELEFPNQQNLILSMENKALKQRLESLAQEQLIKHPKLEHEVLEREIGRLQALYQQQQQQPHQPLQRPSSSHRRTNSRDLDSQFANLNLKHKECSLGLDSFSGPVGI